MRGLRVLLVAVLSTVAVGCPPPPSHPRATEPEDSNLPAEPPPYTPPPRPVMPVNEPPARPADALQGGGEGPISAAPQPPVQAKVVDQMADFAFDGGRIDFEMRQVGNQVVQIARSHYAVPIVMQWNASAFVNMEPTGPADGVVVLPPASKANGEGKAVELVTFQVPNPHKAYRRELAFHARFGDPNARPAPYAYALPFAKKQSYAVLQGFHGTFSHRGSNEFAIDFDCPVATTVLAARDGVVVATNASAIGSGTTPEFLDFHRVNFVLVLHDDGTLGEYMHLSPSGVIVAPGQHVARGEPLALSGNTGFSSTPHLHFQVMTAATDGVAARSFPFDLATGPHRSESPVQGRTYFAWE